MALSGPAALAMTGQWRLALGIFAMLAALLALAAALSLPSARRDQAMNGVPSLSAPLLRLIAASFLMGVASTALWSFGGQLVSEQLDWGSSGIGLLWTSIGVGGIAGALAGLLVNRFGLDRMHRAFLGVMVASLLAVGSVLATPMLALAGGALFGAAYVMLTGVYLVWGVRLLPHRPATGLMVAFLTIAVGQTAGAPAFGLLLGWAGDSVAVTCFSVLALLAGLFRFRPDRAAVPVDLH